MTLFNFQHLKRLALSVMLLGCLALSAEAQPYIDFTDWDAKTQISIDGPWQVIRGKLVQPADYTDQYTGEVATFPDRWHQQKNNIAKKNGWPVGFGSASYRTQFKLPQGGRHYSVIVQTPYTASEVWINGQLMASNGKVTETPIGSQAFYMERHIALPNTPTIEIVLLVSNFEHHAGGILRPPLLDLTHQIDRDTRLHDLSYLFIFGALTALLIFHTAYFLKGYKRGRDWSHFWYCVLVAVVIVRLATLNTILFKIFPDFPEFSDKFLVYVTLYSSSAVYMTFLASIFPHEFPPAVRKFVYFGSIPFLGSVLFLPVHIYTQLQDYFIVFALVVLIYNQGAIIQAWRKKREGSGAVVLFTAFFFVTVFNDALHYMHAFNLRPFSFLDLMPFGFLLLSIGHAIALSAQSRALHEHSWGLAENLKLLNKSLDMKVQQRTKEAMDAKRIAEKSATEKTNFISAASHDLRQPVHALSIFNETLKLASRSDKKLTTIAEKQSILIRSLTEMLETMLDASRLEAKTLSVNMSAVPLEKIFTELLNMMQPIAAQENVELCIIPSTKSVWADEKHLRRILSNLVTNAIKASSSNQKNNGKVVVGCRCNGKDIDLIVADNGCGIPSEDMDRIFDRYAQAGTIRNPHQTGMGLGLAIVKELCSLMGINIDLKSNVNQGTLFRLSTKMPSVPVPMENHDTGIDTKQKMALKRLVVLIVDDSKAAREALTELFRRWGHAARGVSSKDEALTTLDDLGKPDLLVVDYRLDAVTTGLDVIQSIQQRYRDIPAIIITGATAAADLQALAASPFKVFHKPIDPSAFEAYLNEQFHSHPD